MTEIRCIGCGNIIAGDPEIKVWDYTCYCGGHLFTFDGELSLPHSLMSYLAYKEYGKDSPLGEIKSIPHIEYYLGYSDFMDNIKKYAIDQLKIIGSIYAEDCQDEECKRNREEKIAALQEALTDKDNYWRKMSDCQLASHFGVHVTKVRKLKMRQLVKTMLSKDLMKN